MIHPQLETETAINPSELQEPCITRPRKVVFKAQLKSTTRRFGCCCCCNQWAAAHFFMVNDICWYFAEMVFNLVMWEELRDLGSVITKDLLLISCASIGILGLRRCEPEYIGIYLVVTIGFYGRQFAGWFFHIIVLGHWWHVFEILFIGCWLGWMLLVVRKVYQKAVQHTFVKRSYQPSAVPVGRTESFI